MASPRRPQGLWLKRTLIPVCFTLGVICLGLVLLGFTSDLSFAVFRRPAIAAGFLIVGLVMLGLAVVYAMQVRHALRRRASRR